VVAECYIWNVSPDDVDIDGDVIPAKQRSHMTKDTSNITKK